MLLVRLTRFQRQGHRLLHKLFIVQQDQGEDVDDLPIAAGPFGQPGSQLPEAPREFQEGGAIA